MPDLYTPTLTIDGYGVGEATLTIARTDGNDCPELSFVYKNRTPLNLLGCTTFRIYPEPVFDSYYGFYPPCELRVTARHPLGGMISALDYTTDTPNELLSGDPVMSGGLTWGAHVASNGKFGGSYRYYSGGFGNVPTFQGRNSSDTTPAPTTIAAWVSNLNGQTPGSASQTGVVEFTFEEVFPGVGGYLYRLLFIGQAVAAVGGGSEVSASGWGAGDWVAIIVTHDPAAHEMSFYLNNSLVGTITDSGISTNLHSWRIRGSVTVAYAWDRIFTAGERASFQSLTAPIPIP